jgi:hypothetical protein
MSWKPTGWLATVVICAGTIFGNDTGIELMSVGFAMPITDKSPDGCIIASDSATIQNVKISDTISAKTNLSQIETVAQNTTSAVINTNEIKTPNLVSSPITTTQSPTSTTVLHEDFIRMPNGTIISIALLESMDPEQAEMIAEMSEGGI